MLLADGALGVALLLLWVYCLLDVITSDETAVRNLPRLGWLVLVVLLLDVGAIAWLVAGRPRQRPQAAGRSTAVPPEYDRPGRAVAQHPDDDAAFLAQLRERAEQQRRQAAEQARRLREQEDEPPA